MKITEQDLQNALQWQNNWSDFKDSIYSDILNYKNTLVHKYGHIEKIDILGNGGLEIWCEDSFDGKNYTFLIPKEYFLADNKYVWLQDVLKEKKEAEIKAQIAKIDEEKARIAAAEFAMYKRLKEKFENIPTAA